MRSNQRPSGLSRTGRFRPLTEVPHGGARAEGTGRGIEEVLANPTRAVGVARHRFGERQRGALARGEERARGVASHRPELSDREKRLAPPMKAVLDAPAAPRELGGELPHEQLDARVERRPARDVATHPRSEERRAWPREWYRGRSGDGRSGNPPFPRPPSPVFLAVHVALPSLAAARVPQPLARPAAVRARLLPPRGATIHARRRPRRGARGGRGARSGRQDRKSTRLNSSHGYISY